MIYILRRKLAVMLLTIIFIVLVATTAAVLIVSEWQMNMREERDLRLHADALSQQIRMGRPIVDAQIAKTEIDNHLIIHIRDNGFPLDYRGSWNPKTPRETLVLRAADLAEPAGVPMKHAGTADYADYAGEMRGDENERYLIYAVHIGGYRSWQTLILCKDMTAEDAQRVIQRFLFSGITLAGVAVLSIFGWWFTGRAIRPIEKAHRQQGQFVAAASHELRTPLAVMQTGVDALKNAPEHPERFLQQMQQEIVRMAVLASDLMSLTSANEAIAESALGPVELDMLAEECSGEYQAAAQQKCIFLAWQGPASPLPLVEGDVRRIKQAINILIDNAIAYTPQGGHVMVQAAHDDRWVTVTVTDDGPGIATDHRAHIFERFYRADKSRSDRSHNGLGLSIALEIVQAHRGKLIFEPNEPVGSRFVLQLPCMRRKMRDM